ncbi:MAG: phosphate ABC transporter substrate-binding protein PstS [Actinobacteria bacterium]|nr:phosphate ABC transporter substrate-binding protein PstS [Actinomycetota bacterium]
MRRLVTAVIASAFLSSVMLAAGPIAPAGAAAQVNGAGSTWSQIAVDQWRADVARNGLSINYQGLGSTAGRQFYIQHQVDFAISEIPFQPPSIGRDGTPAGDEIGPASARPYAYMPIVAGGTSFMYHLDINGKRITDLHLSGRTLALIFTGVIKNWNDPAISADDGRTFPSMPILPIVRSDGSGTSAQFSLYISKMFPDVWNPFCQRMGLPTPCGLTSLWPYFPGSQAQSGSDGVANFVSAPYNNGAITYVEYGYALERSLPVVSVKNQAGYYVQPTAEDVAIALTRARINPDRTQVLDDVYTNPLPSAYPVSSYSYMIVPTTTAAPMTADKGATLGQFILYFLCTGQQKAKALGYSPLPANLVRFGWDAESLIPGAPAPPAGPATAANCPNPAVTGAFGFNPNSVPGASAAQRPRSGNTTALGATGSSLSGAGSGSGAGAAGTSAPAADASNDPYASGGGTDASGTGRQASLASAVAVNTSGRSNSVPLAIYVAVGLVVLLAIFLPPAIFSLVRRRD